MLIEHAVHRSDRLTVKNKFEGLCNTFLCAMCAPVIWGLVTESIAKVPNDIILHSKNRNENLCLVNPHTFLKAKIHSKATASLVYSCCAKSS